MNKLYATWDKPNVLFSRTFNCGYCGNSIASNMGYNAKSSTSYNNNGYIYICHHCNNPTYFHNNIQFPGAIYGESVTDVPELESNLYNEARSCISCNAYTAAVLCCRKLLMNIAVSRGAKEGLKFIQYVEYLAQGGFIPPDAKEWVDHIRKKGNEATHEIAIMTKQDAEDLIDFVEMLLKIIYTFPATIKKKTKTESA
ncbi:DUF4145 domain-containing protein [Desulfosporosinus hippei]|uniref:DUF4145 domain-containing protein n=1 Tax=Desulfosporosinus hippei DSM 8344 TaxID=1121419 RepID=A0A1G8LPB1_9FIRM|nr:DUF4145 domain-containing protein [Desulfosporosinus hippei]SDI57287.1 protein of unknown function [Desulfosporosinus hippei DSM 8344]